MSFEFNLKKLYSLLFLTKNSGEHQRLSLRFVWSRVCPFLYSLGPRSGKLFDFAAKLCTLQPVVVFPGLSVM